MPAKKKVYTRPVKEKKKRKTPRKLTPEEKAAATAKANETKKENKERLKLFNKLNGEQKIKMVKFYVKMFYRIQLNRMQMSNQVEKANQYINLDAKALKLFAGYADTFKEKEKELETIIGTFIKSTDFWKKYAKNVSGLGPTLAAVIYTSIDIERATTASKILSIAGLGQEKEFTLKYRDGTVNRAGKKTFGKWKSAQVWATSEQNAMKVIPRIKETEAAGPRKLREFKDIARTGNVVQTQRKHTGQYPSFNQFLKNKFIDTLGSSFLKSVSSKYKTFYYDYRERNADTRNEKGEHLNDLHLHRRANRHMLKHFVQDMYAAWRKIEGLEVRVPYAEEYLDKVHSSDVPSPKRARKSHKESVSKGEDVVLS